MASRRYRALLKPFMMTLTSGAARPEPVPAPASGSAFPKEPADRIRDAVHVRGRELAMQRQREELRVESLGHGTVGGAELLEQVGRLVVHQRLVAVLAQGRAQRVAPAAGHADGEDVGYDLGPRREQLYVRDVAQALAVARRQRHPGGRELGREARELHAAQCR